MRRRQAFTGPALGALAIRDYRLFLTGQLVSQLGQWAQLVAQALLVLKLTDSGVVLGAVMMCQYLPTLLFGTWGGVVCDRVDKRRLIIVTQCVLGATASLLGVLVLTDRVTLTSVYVLATAAGLTKAFDDPPRRTLGPDLVPRPLVASAVGLNSAVVQLSRIIGPAIAALFVATIGIGWCFIANGVSFLGVIAATLLIRRDAFPAARLSRAKGQIRQGLRYAWADEELRVILLMLLAIATIAFNWHVVLPLFAKRSLDGDDTTYALLAASMGLGSLLGSLFVARQPSIGLGFLGRSAALFGASALLLAVTPTLAIAAAVTLLWGGSIFVLITAAQTMLQLTAIPVMQGRVMSLFGVVVVGVMPLGGLLSGWLADRYGTRLAIAAGGVVALAAGLGVMANLRRSTDLRVAVPLGQEPVG